MKKWQSKVDKMAGEKPKPNIKNGKIKRKNGGRIAKTNKKNGRVKRTKRRVKSQTKEETWQSRADKMAGEKPSQTRNMADRGKDIISERVVCSRVLAG